MKKMLRIILPATILFMVCACNSGPEKTGKDQFDDQLDSLTSSLENIDKSMDLLTALNNQLEALELKVEAGDLSREQANRLAEELNKKYRLELDYSTQIDPSRHLPVWSTRLGLMEPQGMMLDPEQSKRTSVNNTVEGYNSIKLVYTGNYDHAMEQAEIIARSANIPLSKTYAEALEKAEKYPSALSEIKGITYMNFEPGFQNLKYKISISVSPDGVLTIYAINEQQRKAYFE
ncbi:MAG: hypothetical protein K9G67_04615 [Bacteroidales bacterium]|nr:hypothetical protein [Bacteroidales bacterium]MCF8351409.1 hypothetical protein [Bacteroidales bacterium]MCF8375616.1 hypothetical protein [Bacteroidales bacterium]